MSILVVGSIALDTIETDHGNVDDSPGGSALYFSAAASLFAPVNIVGVVGQDFDMSLVGFLSQRQVDLVGLKVEKGKTFRWGGRYHKNMNYRDTLFTDLNVFETFKPEIPEHYRKSPFLFLANIDPDLQLEVLAQTTTPDLVVLDTMNFWIHGKRESLDKVLKKAGIIIVNDEEIRELTGIDNIHKAARDLRKMGPQGIVIKKGEHGAVLLYKDTYFFAPAYPVEQVIDPTGAGDSFAGGFLGYLASSGQLEASAFRRAVIYGSIVASYNVEAFSFEKLKSIGRDDVESRFQELMEMTRF